MFCMFMFMRICVMYELTSVWRVAVTTPGKILNPPYANSFRGSAGLAWLWTGVCLCWRIHMIEEGNISMVDRCCDSDVTKYD